MLDVDRARPHGTHVLVKFSGRDSIDEVMELSGTDLVVERKALARPAEDFLFDDEVAAFSCISPSGEPIGRAEAFERHGPTVCLRIERGGATFLVPFVHPIVCAVSRERREIVLEPPAGLFEV
jgi:16S rRNA processing protein RimM